MRRTKSRRIAPRLLAGLCLAACFAAGARLAPALTLRNMTMDDVIQSSEAIFVATCEGKRSEFRSGNILTIYTLRPTEFWKGAISTNRVGTFEMEDVGGTVGTTVRMSQFVGGSASLVPGEEALLFTEKYKPSPTLASTGVKPLFTPGNPMIIGRVMGRFSVLTEPSTGEKYVIRPSLESAGVIPNDQSMRQYLNKQQAALKTAVGAPTSSAGVPAGPLLKSIQKGQGVRDRIAKANAAGAPKTDSGASPAEDIKNFELFSSVRSRIMKRVEALARP